MSEFTSGKWEADVLYGDHFVVFANSHVIADCFDNEANARLIAAAPELYHMLAYLLGYVREWEAISSGTVYKKKVSRDISKAETLLACINIEEASHE